MKNALEKSAELIFKTLKARKTAEILALQNPG